MKTLKSLSKIQLTALCLGLAVLLGAGCATTQDVEQLQKQTQMNRDETREMYEILEQEIRKSADPVRAQQADLGAEVQILREEVADLKGQVAELTMRLNYLAGDNNATASLPEVAADVKAISFALEQNLAIDLNEIKTKIAAMQPSPLLTPDGLAAPTIPTPDTATAVADPAQALYDKAYSAFGEGMYDESRKLFGEFITAFGDHSLLSNAIFWQGQSYFELGDYERAILSYQEVIKNFPQSAKMKHSLLKQGIAFYKLGKNDLGKIVLNDLVSKYPDTAEATRAKQYMSEH